MIYLDHTERKVGVHWGCRATDRKKGGQHLLVSVNVNAHVSSCRHLGKYHFKNAIGIANNWSLLIISMMQRRRWNNLFMIYFIDRSETESRSGNDLIMTPFSLNLKRKTLMMTPFSNILS